MAGKTHRIGKSLIDVTAEFGTEESCLNYLETLRWPDGVYCLKCGHDKVSKFSTKEGNRKRVNRKTGEVTAVRVPARRLYECLKPECRHQFSATTGTIFHDTHLPLPKWLLAVAIMCNAKKGVSAKQLERDLNINYRTAWYLAHRIREAMALSNRTDDKMTGVVEMDETYMGGKYDRRRKRERWDKEPVFGMIERNAPEKPSHVRACHIPQVNRWSVYGKIQENVAVEAKLVVTDESQLYKALGRRYAHDIVNHSAKQYVRGEVHTNSIENFWSLFKRGVIGSFHAVSIKHLSRYLAEFCYRFNNRENEELFAITVACLVLGIPLPYSHLISEPQTQTPSDEPF